MSETPNDAFWYCALCYDALSDDPTAGDVISTRYSSRQGLAAHLLDSHDKSEFVERLLRREGGV